MRFNRKEWLFILRWTIVTAVGFTLASRFILEVIFTIGMGGGFENISTHIGIFVQIGLIIGTLIGFGQTLVLIGQAKQLILWIPASILGGILGSLIVSSLGEPALIFSAAIPGILVGTAQRFVLIKSLKKAPGWILANIIGWTVGQIVFFVGIFASGDPNRILKIIDGRLSFNLFPELIILLASGAMPGLITGIHLAWSLRNFKKE